MNKEELKKLYKKYETAKLAYQEYVKPFFTTLQGGQIIKQGTKFLNREKLNKFKELREIQEQTYKEWWGSRTAFYRVFWKGGEN